jgi:hypothetical protein
MFEVTKKQFDLMKYYTKLFLMLFAVLGAVSGLIFLIVGYNAY